VSVVSKLDISVQTIQELNRHPVHQPLQQHQQFHGRLTASPKTPLTPKAPSISKAPLPSKPKLPPKVAFPPKPPLKSKASVQPKLEFPPKGPLPLKSTLPIIPPFGSGALLPISGRKFQYLILYQVLFTVFVLRARVRVEVTKRCEGRYRND
jgi:hypothetical protein